MHLPKSEQIVVARHDPARSVPRSGSLGEAFQLGVRQRYRVKSPPRERVAKGKSTRLMLFGRRKPFGQCPDQAARPPLARHNHFGADVHAVEKINDVFVEHAYAPVCREGADGVRPVRTVDGVLLATGQRQRAWTHRVSWRTAGDHVGQPRVVAPDLVRRPQAGLTCLPSISARPCHCLPALPTPTG